MKRALGVCYYPEHWPEDLWAEDAARMAEAGISHVRLGEFAWSRIEPAPGRLDWGWLDRAIETLAASGLRPVLGTPSATPPRWMLEKFPDMLAKGADGRPRGFGSRRHYCFSHEGYRKEAARIAGQMAERYGSHEALAGWQIDNEFACHDTALSYSEAARDAFRAWLAARYGNIAALNAAWGNVFWSMEYAGFDEIGLPAGTVTEPSPAHLLAFRRFSSEQIVRFARAQAEAIRAHSAAPLLHNYMGGEIGFDHFALGAGLDAASWDSYPLGNLQDSMAADRVHRTEYARQGDPDFQAFHHDLYRAVGRGRWWVMEQQPGPVNWARVNPDPLPGAVRLWSWEAFAHGAEIVSYFRWRQVPYAQEQMHSGLIRPDGVAAPGLGEARRVAGELEAAPEVQAGRAPVALIYDYEAAWGWQIQPHGQGLSYFELVFSAYRGLRGLGASIDILPPTTRDFTGYRLILAPGLLKMSDALKAALAASGAELLIGPRSGARSAEMAIPVPLPPSLPGLDVTVARVESLRPEMPVPLAGGGAFTFYRERLEGGAEVALAAADGAPALMRAGRLGYLGGWPDAVAWRRILTAAMRGAGLAPRDLPQGLRLRETGTERFWFNYGAEPLRYEGRELAACGVLREPVTEA